MAAFTPRDIINDAPVASSDAPVVTNVLLLISDIRPPLWSIVCADCADLEKSNRNESPSGLELIGKRKGVSNP